MAGNDHWGSLRWKTKSLRRQWFRYSTRYRGEASRGPRWFRGALDALYVGIKSKKVNYVVDLS